MSVFDDWEWGYCPKCQREVALTVEKHLIVHRLSTQLCPGNGMKPADPPKETHEEQLRVPEVPKRAGKKAPPR